MKKLVLLAATAALSLWGCASTKGYASADERPLRELTNEKLTAQKSRMGAPTVYNGEATGGAGFTVTTADGQTWAPEESPGNTVLTTPSDARRSLERHARSYVDHDGKSQVIDEGKTDQVSRR